MEKVAPFGGIARETRDVEQKLHGHNENASHSMQPLQTKFL